MRTTAHTRMLVSVLLALMLAPALAGCGSASQENRSASYSPAKPSGAPAPPAASPEAAIDSAGQGQAMSLAPASEKKTADRLVIRNGNVRLEVAKVPDAVSSVRALAKRYGGVIAQLQLSSETDGGTPQPLEGSSERAVQTGLPFNASVTVLVPVAKFDDFRAEASKLGRVLSEGSADDDVTQQHVDLKARLDNAKAEELRLRGFFDNAKSVTDMLAIEKELARVRGDIEAMTAQITTMERQAAMATLTIELVEPKPIIRPESGIDWGFREALRTGIQGMVDVLKVAIVVVLATAPLWIAGIALVLVIRWRVRVRRARAAVPEAPAE